jgi:hypothetical protein
MADHMTLGGNAVIPVGRHRWGLLPVTALSLAGVLLLSPPQSSSAQDVGGFWYGYGSQPPRRPAKWHHRALPSRAARRRDDDGDRPGRRDVAKDKVPAGPLFAILSLSNQHISIYSGSNVVAGSKVSTGMPGHSTPTGIFSIIGRERWHRSNIYSGAPMPFMQRITWSGIALHLGVVPGYPASHGCIRLPAGFAQQLWGMTKVGERVVIAPREVAPVEMTHPLLPGTKLQPASSPVSENPPIKIEVATSASDPLPGAPPKMLNPIEYARSLMVRTAAEVASATKAVREFTERAGAKADEARKAVAELRVAEAARAQLDTLLVAKMRAVETAKTPEAKSAAESAKAVVEAQLVEAGKKLEDARGVEALKSGEAFEAKRALIEARAALTTAQAAAKEAVRRLSPVSVLVSRKDKRVYIRQALSPVLDSPVTIRDPEIPIGTHVYIAVSPRDEGSSFAWSVVSIPSSSSSGHARNARRDTAHAQNTKPEQVLLPSTAAEALERVELPKDVSERISELLWTGGSLIISDQPVSDETSDIGTDLVVTTR